MENTYQNTANENKQNQRGFGKNFFLDSFKNETGKLPPQAPELEEAVLGALMIEKDALTTVVDILQPTSFYKDAHQRIYHAILQLFNRSEPIDMLTVATQLRSTGELEFVGGSSYLAKLTSKVNSAANIEYHARIITQSAIKRDMIRIAGDILKDAYDDTTDVFSLLDKTEQTFFQISERNIRKNYADASSIMRATIDELEKKKNHKDGLTGVGSGFTALDRITSGWQNTELIIIAARPAMGKCLGKGTKVLLFDGTLKNVEEIQTSDLLMGDDSTPRKVLSIARGKEKMFWVKQSHGINYRVNESHILSLKNTEGNIINIEIKDYLTLNEQEKIKLKGYKVAVEFEENFPIFAADLYHYGQQFVQQKNSKPLFTWEGFKQKQTKESFTEIMVDEIVDVLPKDYLTSNRNNRLHLLAGLIDGMDEKYLEISDKSAIILNLSSKKQAKQIKFLADTLGFSTQYEVKNTEINSLQVVFSTHILSISGNLLAIPSQKYDFSGISISEPILSDIEVIFDQEDDYYGFSIDQNRLFLLEDMTVTHNTAFVVSAMRNAAIEWNIPVAMFSLEMSATQLMLRLISAEAEIDSNKLRKGKLESHEWVQLHKKITNLSNAPIYIDDTPALSILEMRAKCRKLKAQYNIGLVIIDYLQLMTADGGNSVKGNREQEIAAISRAMKNLAKEINVPVIALSQLSRAVETRGGDKRPQLSDLRESGSIEQDADMVMFLYRPEYYKITQDENGNSTEGLGEVIIAKNRSGDVDTVQLQFIGKYTKFTDLDGFYSPLKNQDNFNDFNGSNSTQQANPFESFEKSPTNTQTRGGTVTLGSKANTPRDLDKDSEGDYPF